MTTLEQIDMSSVILLCIGVLLIGLLSYYRKVTQLGIRLDEGRRRHAVDDQQIRNLQETVISLKYALQEANRRNEENLEFFLADIQPEHIPPDVRKRMQGKVVITTARYQ